MRQSTLPPRNVVRLRPGEPDPDQRVRRLVEGAGLLYQLPDDDLVRAIRLLREMLRGERAATP